MSPESDDIRRVDVGEGVFVHVGTGACTAAPSRRIPRPALAAGAVAGIAALARVGAGPAGLLAAGLLPVLVALAAVDLRARVLPNRIVLPTAVAVAAWQLVFFPSRWAELAAAAAGAGAILLLPGLLRPGAVGMGDVKLAALLGLALGAHVATALMIAALAAVPAAMVLIVRRGARATIPYGPFLALGAAVVLLAAPTT